MFQLTGEYECKMDPKGRIKLPAGLIRQLSASGSLSFVINRGFEKCLMLYPKEVWDQKTQEVNNLNIYIPKPRCKGFNNRHGRQDTCSQEPERIRRFREGGSAFCLPRAN